MLLSLEELDDYFHDITVGYILSVKVLTPRCIFESLPKKKNSHVKQWHKF